MEKEEREKKREGRGGGRKGKGRKAKYLQCKKGSFQPSRYMPVECSLQEKETIPEKVAVLHSYPSQDVGNNAICKGDDEI